MLPLTKRILIITLILAALALAGYGYAVWDFRAKEVYLHQLDQEIKLQEDEQSQMQAVADSMDRLTSDFEAIKSRLLGPTETDVLDFIESLEEAADEIGSDFVTSNLSDSEYNGYRVLEVRASFQGRWQEVFSALMLIESMPYRLEVKDFRLRQNPRSDNNWEAQADFIVYRLPLDHFSE